MVNDLQLQTSTPNVDSLLCRFNKTEPIQVLFHQVSPTRRNSSLPLLSETCTAIKTRSIEESDLIKTCFIKVLKGYGKSLQIPELSQQVLALS